MTSRTPLSRPVQAIEDIPSYLFVGGWGDGPSVLRKGSLVYLDYQDEGQVYYFAGSHRPAPGSINEGLGGIFDAIHLSKVRDFMNQLGKCRLEDMQAALQIEGPAKTMEEMKAGVRKHASQKHGRKPDRDHHKTEAELVREVLMAMDPTWSGGTPKFRPPVQVDLPGGLDPIDLILQSRRGGAAPLPAFKPYSAYTKG